MSLLGLILDRPHAGSPVPLTGTRRGFSLSQTTSGSSRRSQLDAPSAASTLFAIQDSLKTSVAQVEWGLFKQDDQNPFTQEPWSQREFLAPVKHPAAKLLNNPNPFMSRMDFMERVQQTYDLTGEGWILVEKFGKLPVGLWPARPDRMEVIGHPTECVKGYIYHSPDGEEIPLKTDDVIRLTNPHPLDPHRGMGAVQTIMAEIALYDRGLIAKTDLRTSLRAGGHIAADRSNEAIDDEAEVLEI